MSKGCNDCRHYDLGKMSFGGPDGTELISGNHSCKNGNDKEFENWWEENGHKKTSMPLTSVHCVEETEFGHILHGMAKVSNRI